MHLLTCRSIKALIIKHRSASGGRPNFPGPNHPKAEPSWGQTNQRPTQPQTEPSRGGNILRPNHREVKPTGGQTIQRPNLQSPNHPEAKSSNAEREGVYSLLDIVFWFLIINLILLIVLQYSSVDLMVLC